MAIGAVCGVARALGALRSADAMRTGALGAAAGVAAVQLHASAGRSSIPWRRRWRRIRRREVPAEAPGCRGLLSLFAAAKLAESGCRARRSLCPSSRLSRYLHQHRRPSNRPIGRTGPRSVVGCRAPGPSRTRRRRSPRSRSAAGFARSDCGACRSGFRVWLAESRAPAGFRRRARELCGGTVSPRWRSAGSAWKWRVRASARTDHRPARHLRQREAAHPFWQCFPVPTWPQS